MSAVRRLPTHWVWVLVTVVALLLAGGLVEARRRTLPASRDLPAANAFTLSNAGYTNVRSCISSTMDKDDPCYPRLQLQNRRELVVWCAVAVFYGENSDGYSAGDYGLPLWFMITDTQTETTGFAHASLVHLREPVPWCAEQSFEATAKVSPAVTWDLPELVREAPRAPEMVNSWLELTATRADGHGWWYSVQLRNYRSRSTVMVECVIEGVTRRRAPVQTDDDGSGTATDACQFSEYDSGQASTGTVFNSPVAPPSGRTAPLVTLAKGAANGGAYWYSVSVAGFSANATVSVTCHDTVSPDGFKTFPLTTGANGGGAADGGCFSGDGPDHWVVAGGTASNHVSWVAGPTPGPTRNGGGPTTPGPTRTTGPTTGTTTTAPPPPPTPTRAETVGGVTHTWTNSANAGGTEGPVIAAHQTVQISCKLIGFAVQNGNRWWYRIASPGWDNRFYASADAFYNNGQTTGTLLGTPYVDTAVPDC